RDRTVTGVQTCALPIYTKFVGIVGNTKEFGVARPAPPTLFVPAAQVQDGLTKLVNQAMPLVWVVRTTGDPRLLAKIVQQSLQGEIGRASCRERVDEWVR